MADYSIMTIAELRAEFVNLVNQLTVIQNNRMTIYNLINQRTAEAKAKIRIQNLDTIEKDALKSVLNEL